MLSIRSSGNRLAEVLSVLAACSPAGEPEPEGKTLRIGVDLPVTGPESRAAVLEPLDGSVTRLEIPIANAAALAMLTPTTSNPCLTRDLSARSAVIAELARTSGFDGTAGRLGFDPSGDTTNRVTSIFEAPGQDPRAAWRLAGAADYSARLPY